jgi:hypothetical protein
MTTLNPPLDYEADLPEQASGTNYLTNGKSIAS